MYYLCQLGYCDSPMPTFQKIPPLFRFRRVIIFICRIMRIISIASASRCHQFSKVASVVSCRFTSLSVLSPTAHARARGIVKSLFLKVCVKLSLIEVKLGTRSH